MAPSQVKDRRDGVVGGMENLSSTESYALGIINQSHLLGAGSLEEPSATNGADKPSTSKKVNDLRGISNDLMHEGIRNHTTKVIVSTHSASAATSPGSLGNLSLTSTLYEPDQDWWTNLPGDPFKKGNHPSYQNFELVSLVYYTFEVLRVPDAVVGDLRHHLRVLHERGTWIYVAATPKEMKDAHDFFERHGMIDFISHIGQDKVLQLYFDLFGSHPGVVSRDRDWSWSQEKRFLSVSCTGEGNGYVHEMLLPRGAVLTARDMLEIEGWHVDGDVVDWQMLINPSGYQGQSGKWASMKEITHHAVDNAMDLICYSGASSPCLKISDLPKWGKSDRYFDTMTVCTDLQYVFFDKSNDKYLPYTWKKGESKKDNFVLEYNGQHSNDVKLIRPKFQKEDHVKVVGCCMKDSGHYRPVRMKDTWPSAIDVQLRQTWGPSHTIPTPVERSMLRVESCKA